MSTEIRMSRMVPFSDVPEVQGFAGKFVYNFFVPDEMNNDEGTPRFHGALSFFTDAGQKSVVDTYGHQVSTTTINAETPRFIELDWQPAALVGVKNFFDSALGEDGFIEKHKQSLNDEASMGSQIDAQSRKSNLNLREKLVKKINLISKIKSPQSTTSELTVPQIGEQFNDILDIDSLVVENLISKLAFADTGYVNERRLVDRTSQFLRAEQFNIFSNIDRRVGAMIFNPLFRLNNELINQYDDFRKDASSNHSHLKSESQKNHFELGIKVLPGKEELPLNSTPEFEAVPVGYIISRASPDANTGLFKNDRTYYVDGAENTKFLDTNIVYSMTYRYVINAVYAVKFVTPIADDHTYGASVAGFYRMLALVKSKKSKSVVIKTEELVPPAEPDGVLYRYNYDEGTGLLINWQMPVGKQRDIKYFQVFRRRNIKEPFTCIAELDFNDAVTTYKGNAARLMPRTERVRQDRVYKSQFPRVFLNDSRFDRQSKFIYAVAAVDAHGLTSGYSAQTEVGFDRNSNSLTLATISRAGAPKQYPNFFIDPKLDDNFTVDSLTTDAMTSSKKQTITVYLDPDAVSATIDVPAPTPGKIQEQKVRIIRSINKNNAEYVMNIINVDRQVSKNFTIELKHLRSDPGEL